MHTTKDSKATRMHLPKVKGFCVSHTHTHTHTPHTHTHTYAHTHTHKVLYKYRKGQRGPKKITNAERETRQQIKETNQRNQCIAARKKFERAVGRPRPAPGLVTPGSRPPPRTALVCSLPAPGALNSRVLLRIPIGSVDVGTTTTLLAARALPNNCSCVPNCQHNPASPSPALL